MPDSLQSLNKGDAPSAPRGNALSRLTRAARQHQGGKGLPPVDDWHPDYCGQMDLVIRADGSWWHEGGRINREPLVKLFASILRKDADGVTYLVTPVEKIAIQVERAPFTAVRLDVVGGGEDQRLFLTTNLGDVVEVGPDHPLRVETDPQTLEPAPFVLIRGRLEALLTRPVFYDLVDQASLRETPAGEVLGVYAGGAFFALGPAGIHHEADGDNRPGA